MTFDPSQLGALAGSLARAGLPALGTLLGVVVPPPYDLLVKPAFSAVAWALNIDPGATDAVGQVQAKVDADPQGTVRQLQPVEAAHQDAATAIDAYLADVANARAMNVQMVQSGSSIAWATPSVALVAIVGFLSIATYLAIVGDTNIRVTILAAMIGGWTTVLNFYLGSSKGGADRAEQITSMLRQTIPPAAPVVPKPVPRR